MAGDLTQHRSRLAQQARCGWIGAAQIAYAATKAGVIQFSKVLAVQYAAQAIRVNTVVPGQLHTPMVESRLAGQRAGGDVDRLLAQRLAPLTLASPGIGSIPHFVMEQLADASKVPITHVPYKGAVPAITDVMGGQVDAFFGDVPGLIGHIRGHRLRPVALAAEKRHPLLPDVPTLGELGMPGIDSDNWYALFVPAKTDPAMIAKLNAAVRKAIADPAINAKLAATGAEPKSSTPQELGDLLDRDTAKWKKIIESRGITAQ